jgi:hypothetical protein
MYVHLMHLGKYGRRVFDVRREVLLEGPAEGGNDALDEVLRCFLDLREGH